MEYVDNNQEIDLKLLRKRILNVIRGNKKSLSIFFTVIMLFSLAYFVSVILKPSYKAEVIVKSKVVKYDQLKKVIEKINSNIENPNLNPIKNETSNYIHSSEIYLINLKKNEVDIKEKDEPFKLYSLNIYFSKYPETNMVDGISNLIESIQFYCSKDNEIIEQKKRLNNSISELDSLIRVAYNVGYSYEENMKKTSSSQIMIMNDMYKGINDLINQKLIFKMESSFLESNNILFVSSPIVLTKKIEKPFLIFLVGIGFFIFISSIWIAFELIFGDY